MAEFQLIECPKNSVIPLRGLMEGIATFLDAVRLNLRMFFVVPSLIIRYPLCRRIKEVVL